MEGVIYRCVQRTNENTPRRIGLDRFSHPPEKEAQKCCYGEDSQFYRPLDPVGVSGIDEFSVVKECESGIAAGKLTDSPSFQWSGGHHFHTGLPYFESMVSGQGVLNPVATA